MQIMLVAATEMEISGLRNEFSGLDFLITGVGAPACLYAVTKALQRRRYDLVIQAGIAGTFEDKLKPGETVMVKKDLFADLGFAENGDYLSLTETVFGGPDMQPYKAGWLVNETKVSLGRNLKQVAGITVNTVGDDLGLVEKYRQKYDAKVESMEGAAFHYACIMEAQPFVQLRAISNKVGVRDKGSWHITEAVGRLQQEVSQLIHNITKQL